MTAPAQETIEIGGIEYERVHDYGSGKIILLRGSCDKPMTDVGEDGSKIHRTCHNGASVRTIKAPENTEDRCGLHLTSRMKNGLDGKEISGKEVLNLEQSCDKMVNPRPDAEFSISEPCDDTAFIRVVSPDGSVKDYCRRHAREVWLTDIQVDEENSDK